MVLDKNEITMEDKMIVQNSLNLWVGCIMHNNSLLEEFYQYKTSSFSSVKDAETFIVSGLYCFRAFKVREYFQQSLECLAATVKGDGVKTLPLVMILKSLLNHFPKEDEDTPDMTTDQRLKLVTKDSKQYFELMKALLTQYFDPETQKHPRFEKFINPD
jgi:hypothetical protein